MRAYAHTNVCIVYSVVANTLPQLRIKCGVAKSCLGAHTALQAPMHLIGVLPQNQLSQNQLPLNQLPIDQLSYHAGQFPLN